jgi:putative hydrolase of the HAD superfamily
VKPLHGIFFDLDDTLTATSRFAARARQAAVEAMSDFGLRESPETLRRELDEVVTEFSSNYGYHFDKLLLRVRQDRYDGVNPAILIAAGVVAYHRTKQAELEPYPDAVKLLRQLQPSSLVVGIITAGRAVKQAEKLIRLGLVPLLHPKAIFISEQIGINKPNPKIFARACVECGLDPQYVMYVGDNPAHDILPPLQMGMIAVRLRRDGKYINEDCEQAAHEITNYDELAKILVMQYGIACIQAD